MIYRLRMPLLAEARRCAEMWFEKVLPEDVPWVVDIHLVS
jgi:hypothetical protein